MAIEPPVVESRLGRGGYSHSTERGCVQSTSGSELVVSARVESSGTGLITTLLRLTLRAQPRSGPE